jgi:hypothetical protein
MGIKKLFKRIFRGRPPEPDVGIYIHYYHDTKMLALSCYPEDLSEEQVLSFMYYAADLIEVEEVVELFDEDDVEKYILGKEPEKKKGHLTLVKG